MLLVLATLQIPFVGVVTFEKASNTQTYQFGNVFEYESIRQLHKVIPCMIIVDT